MHAVFQVSGADVAVFDGNGFGGASVARQSSLKRRCHQLQQNAKDWEPC